MKTLREALQETEGHRVAIGHFNFSELSVLKAAMEVARDLNAPVLVGVSEGEREFVGVRQAAALVKSYRDEFNHPIFLNADHTQSLEHAEEAAKAGLDLIVFDRSSLPFEKNENSSSRSLAPVQFEFRAIESRPFGRAALVAIRT